MKTAVITTRNDNYGMFLAERAMQCLNCMVEVFDEVILVDWNSPHDLPLIDQIKNYIQPTGKLRSIVVDKEFVSQNSPQNAQPCCEVLARNVGIRRAKGDWIVSTNIDVIPTPFSTEVLDKNKMYTVAKYNVLENVHLTQLISMSPQEKIKALVNNKHILERMQLCKDVVPSDVYSLVIGCGDFQVAHRTLWDKIRGFEEEMVHRCFSDTNVQVKAHHMEDCSVELLNIDIFHLEHKNNPYFWNKDNKTIRNSMEEATNKYSKTKNGTDWGYALQTFKEEII